MAQAGLPQFQLSSKNETLLVRELLTETLLVRELLTETLVAPWLLYSYLGEQNREPLYTSEQDGYWTETPLRGQLYRCLMN